MIILYSQAIGVLTMTDCTNEEWRAIPEAPTYSVSNFGRSKRDSHTTINNGSGGCHTYPEKILKLCDDGRGYLCTTAYFNGRHYRLYAHQCVLHAFVGKQEKGIEVRHLNSDSKDNRLENLCYGTKSENMKDAVKLGTLIFSRSKLTKNDVIAIGRDTRPIRTIAKNYGICEATVFSIKTGKSFKGWTKEIYYKPKQRRELSPQEMSIILDSSIPRKEIMHRIGITLAQVKSIRKTKKNVIFC